MKNAHAFLRYVRQRDGFIDFARLKLAGNTQQTKNCSKGWPCGFTCLSRSKKNCKKQLDGQSKDLQQWLEKGSKSGDRKLSIGVVDKPVQDAVDLLNMPSSDLEKIGPTFVERAKQKITESLGVLKSQVDAYETQSSRSRNAETKAKLDERAKKLRDDVAILEDALSKAGDRTSDSLTGLTKKQFLDSSGVAMDAIRADTAKRLGVNTYDVKELDLSADGGQMLAGLSDGSYKAANLKTETPEQALKALEDDDETSEFIKLLAARASDKKIRETLGIDQDRALQLSVRVKTRLGVQPNQTTRDRLKEIRGKK